MLDSGGLLWLLRLACAGGYRGLRTGVPWPDLASRFFVLCFLDSSGCAWNSSIVRFGSRMYNRRTAGKPADRSRVSADKLESRA